MKTTILILIVNFLLINSTFAQWQQTGGPVSGFVSDIEIIGSNVFAGFRFGGGVFRSADNGANWTGVNKGLTNRRVWGLASSGNNLYAATDGGGVFVTTDNGNNWTSINNGLTELHQTVIAASGSNIFAGSSSGKIFRSIDNGNNWTAVKTDVVGEVGRLAINNNKVYVVYGGAAYCSADNGDNWTKISTYGRRSIAFIGDDIYLGDLGGVHKSSDNGTTWTTVNTGINVLDVIALKAVGTTLYAGTQGGAGLQKSTNNGTSWTVQNSTWPQYIDINAIAVTGSNFIVGTDYCSLGILRSTDNGVNWRISNTGLATGNARCMTVCGNNVFIIASNGIVKISDSNPVWTNVPYPGTSVFDKISSNGTTLLISGGAYSYTSANNGATWTLLPNGLTTNGSISDSKMNGNAVFLKTSNGNQKSIDNGTTWIPTSINFDCCSFKRDTIFTTFGFDKINISTDNGSNWAAFANVPLSSYGVYSLTVCNNYLYALVTLKGVYKISLQGSGAWTTVNTGLPNFQDINSITTVQNNLIAHTAKGIYICKKTSDIWEAATTGMEGVSTNLMVENNGTIYAGPSDYYGGAGVWKRSATDLFGIATGAESLQQTEFSLYPNPVSNTLKIDNTAQNSVISVLSAAGKLIKTTISTNPHMEIPVSELPTGVYLLKVNDSIRKFVKL